MAQLPLRSLILSLTLSLAFVFLGSVAAQPVATDQDTPPLEQQEDGEHEEVSGALTSAPPGIVSLGVSAGFPSYQTIALNASLQVQYIGFQFKGSWTAAGPYIGGQVRAYPPIPIPVPVYLGVGGGVYGSNASFHAAIGAHVPLGKNLRFDLEGGIANVPVLDERAWAPHLAAGISYAFPVDLSASSAAATEAPTPETERVASPSCEAPREPDRSLLSGAVAGTVAEWLRSAQATFGSIYRDLSYSYTIASTRLEGSTAHVTVQYRGSVTEILTGTRHSATGTASASYSWNGCRWRGGSVEY